ncbi:hypothetical protein [Actinokineospora pegani]|uniref:hypothetical protein n=1 Tax=Actinokineospora pegani TaxID=2654637 RepID=UPI0012EA8C2F|nr:hypothetical protein [Actinokineospora pegani]
MEFGLERLRECVAGLEQHLDYHGADLDEARPVLVDMTMRAHQASNVVVQVRGESFGDTCSQLLAWWNSVDPGELIGLTVTRSGNSRSFVLQSAGPFVGGLDAQAWVRIDDMPALFPSLQPYQGIEVGVRVLRGLTSLIDDTVVEPASVAHDAVERVIVFTEHLHQHPQPLASPRRVVVRGEQDHPITVDLGKMSLSDGCTVLLSWHELLTESRFTVTRTPHLGGLTVVLEGVALHAGPCEVTTGVPESPKVFGSVPAHTGKPVGVELVRALSNQVVAAT